MYQCHIKMKKGILKLRCNLIICSSAGNLDWVMFFLHSVQTFIVSKHVQQVSRCGIFDNNGTTFLCLLIYIFVWLYEF